MTMAQLMLAVISIVAFSSSLLSFQFKLGVVENDENKLYRGHGHLASQSTAIRSATFASSSAVKVASSFLFFASSSSSSLPLPLVGKISTPTNNTVSSSFPLIKMMGFAMAVDLNNVQHLHKHQIHVDTRQQPNPHVIFNSRQSSKSTLSTTKTTTTMQQYEHVQTNYHETDIIIIDNHDNNQQQIQQQVQQEGEGKNEQVEKLQQQQQQQQQQQYQQTTMNTHRKMQTSSNPTDHYFCGFGLADASKTCTTPCPSGSPEDCPPGQLCYFGTICDARDLPGYPFTPPAPLPASPPSSPSSTTTTTTTNTSLQLDKSPPPTARPQEPTAAPWSSDDRRYTFFCGKSWADASEQCQVWCPNADDETTCPYGETCFSDTACKHTQPPTPRPTKPKPSRSPTPQPTDPTFSPTGELMPELPSNHYFCGVTFNDAKDACSLETHCKNNADCKAGQACWNHLEFPCDVREFIPVEEGGNLGRGDKGPGKMTQQEIAESMGLSYPSDNPADHYFCGISIQDIEYKCSKLKPCPSGLSVSCDHGQICFHDTPCDARVRSDYGMTEEPSPNPTPSPVGRDDPVNSRFCGSDWSHANSCRTQWCPTGMGCPYGLSCFEQTECNIQDRGPIRPTKTPTWAPVAYTDPMNSMFCGMTYLDAIDKCSIRTHCKTGTHSECDKGSYCWPGVPCNVVDLNPPTTSRPTPDTYPPTKSPLPYDDPANYKFCGETWSDASTCTNNRWCPNDTGCPEGQQCFADTTCHIEEFTFPPTDEPTNSPTRKKNITYVPSKSPIPFNHPSRTSFCGTGYLEAGMACSIESHCPSGRHEDCGTGEYCWVGVTCNILYLLPPSPPPTPRPTQNPTLEFWPSDVPSSSPSSHPTGIPTMSPLPEDDIRLTFFCGYSWDDASQRCLDRCPDTTTANCPDGQTCFSGTSCPKPKKPNPPSANEPSPNPPSTSPAPVTVSPVTPPTISPVEDQEPTTSPTNEPATLSPITNLTTASPTISPTNRVVSIPSAFQDIPRPPEKNVVRIEHIINYIQSSLENEIFVMETRGGSVIKSSLYTFNGFRSGLLFHSTIGVDDTYFYLGEEQFSTEAQELEIEYGIVNLALFMAKMKTDTIAYERCDPNLLACGMWSLDTAFSSQEQELRILCSSGDAGMECASESVGCACILGLLTHQIGAVDFCVLDPYQSICSRNINQGEELRWITAMTYWSYFVQRYSEDTGWVYLNSLRQFVRDGMIDVNFLDRVARMSIMKGPAESIETTSARPTTQQFVANFFKIITTLTDGASQLKPLVTSSPTTTKTPPTKTPTSVPSESPILSDPNPTDSSTDKPSFPPTNAQFIGDTIISNPPTKSPISEVETQSGLSEAKLCPFLCVVPVSTQECPAPDRELNLSGCLYINHNELCRASGECDTNASLNNCGNGLNIYRRVDCSVIGLTPVPTESGSPSSPTSFNTATTSWVSQESSSRPSGAIPSPVSSPPTSISSIAKPSVEDNAWYKSYWTSPSSASSHCFVGWKNIGIASCLFIMCDLF